MAFQADGDNFIHFRLAHDLDLSDEIIDRLHPKYKSNGKVKQFTSKTGLPRRKENYNTQGKKVLVNVNQFKISAWPQAPIAQFDIKVTPGSGDINDAQRINEAVINKVWNYPSVKQWRDNNFDDKWIFDGKKIAWNKVHMKKGQDGRQEHTIRVDLDYGNPRRNPADLSNVFNITFRQTTQIKMQAIGAFLTQKMDFTNDVYEAINFLDHVLRESPSQQYTQVKRSFFTWDALMGKQEIINDMYLDPTIEFMRGVYASVRLCHMPSPSSTGLAVNLDVANGLFWAPTTLDLMCLNWCSNRVRKNPRMDQVGLANDLKPVLVRTPENPSGEFRWSPAFKELRKFCKLKIRLVHKGKNSREAQKLYTIKRFVIDPQHMNRDGANAKNTTFVWKDKAAGTQRVISVYDYMRQRYNQSIRYWQLPLVETTKGGCFPMEYCKLAPKQRFPFKTDPAQTAKMIKFAVQRPKQRLEAIAHGLRMLKWDSDPYMKHFGIQIDQNLTTTDARLLKNPEILYANKKINPGTTGRWNIQNVKFLKPNTEPLKSWGIVALQNCVDEATMSNFAKQFVSVYTSHGGIVEAKIPHIGKHLGPNEFIPDLCSRVRDECSKKFNRFPQMMMWVLPDGNADNYARLKKNMECRFGMVSQMMKKEHVIKASPQYCSNVCMKFNAKLGGTTNRIAGREKDGGHNYFPKLNTMVIGADLSHPSINSDLASMAAMTMNADKYCSRYWASCQSNGYRVEMISPGNIQFCMMRLFPRWVREVGGGKGPEHIYYFRDGVSEGQYAQVLDTEVKSMKAAILASYPQAKCAFTVIVCGKRHKIRFFPKSPDAADRNANPLPGTLVERDVTHPFEHDFYLSSHSAIQGTARPTHYHVIMDEANVPVNDLHKMIYEHCYQYMRSTTPVSLYPAVYYAHLAAARARAHENADPNAGARHGAMFEEADQDYRLGKALGKPEPRYDEMNKQQKAKREQEKQDKSNIEAPPLQGFGSGLPVEDGGRGYDRMTYSMWYI